MCVYMRACGVCVCTCERVGPCMHGCVRVCVCAAAALIT